MYSVRNGDTLITLAAHFETTVKSILHVNPHVLEAGDLWAGVDLCILPCTTYPPGRRAGGPSKVPLLVAAPCSFSPMSGRKNKVFT